MASPPKDRPELRPVSHTLRRTTSTSRSCDTYIPITIAGSLTPSGLRHTEPATTAGQGGRGSRGARTQDNLGRNMPNGRTNRRDFRLSEQTRNRATVYQQGSAQARRTPGLGHSPDVAVAVAPSGDFHQRQPFARRIREQVLPGGEQDVVFLLNAKGRGGITRRNVRREIVAQEERVDARWFHRHETVTLVHRELRPRLQRGPVVERVTPMPVELRVVRNGDRPIRPEH